MNHKKIWLTVGVLTGLLTCFPVSSHEILPKGAIIAFERNECPDGWEPYPAARGRFLLGANGDLPDKEGNLSPIDVGDTGGNWVHGHRLVRPDRRVYRRADDDCCDNVVANEVSVPPYIGVLFCEYFGSD